MAALPNFAGETSRRRETVRDWGRPALRSPPCYAHRLATAGKPELRAFGEHRYGERAAVVKSEDWEGPELGACMNAASVCRSNETSRRRELLSFSHHAEVAALPVKQQEKLLDRAEAEGMRTRNLRAEVAQTRAALHSQEVSRRVTATPGKFGTVAMDPPGPMEKILRDVRPNQVESDNPPNSRAKAVLVFIPKLLL